MTTGRTAIPTGRPFTVADLEAMPDDGNRYELIDGMLIVGPAPGWSHQEMGGALTAFELDGAGAYRETGRAVGDEEFRAARPFPVTITPTRLLDGLRP